jgi:leucyl-tRNA synthetase
LCVSVKCECEGIEQKLSNVWLTDCCRYGEEEWRTQVQDYVNGPFECFDPKTKQKFNETLEWLHEHACSRQYGLGSRLPWDEEWMIESLSDSTIYMAYYTVAHMLQGGSLTGANGGPLGITVEELTREVWDHIFLGTEVSAACPVSAEKLAILRNEFMYFYPMDLRVTGKDLVPNHLTYALYNHAAIFPPEMWPRAFRANGLLQLNHEKMSKSTGNFLTLQDSINLYTADITRLACADAGDSLEDANFEQKAADSQLVHMYAELDWVNTVLKTLPNMRAGPIEDFADRAFLTCIDQAVHASAVAYDDMNFREALKISYFELQGSRDDYRDMMKLTGKGPHRDVVMHYIRVQYVVLAPICPHICEHVWKLIGRKGSLMADGRWPEAAVVDMPLFKAFKYIGKMAHVFRLRINSAKAKSNKKGKGKKGGGTGGDAAAAPAPVIAKVTVYAASEYPVWQRIVLAKLDEMFDEMAGTFADNRSVLGALKGNEDLKKVMKKVMPFVQFVREQVAEQGRDALSQVMPFDELEVLKVHPCIPHFCTTSTVLS